MDFNKELANYISENISDLAVYIYSHPAVKTVSNQIFTINFVYLPPYIMFKLMLDMRVLYTGQKCMSTHFFMHFFMHFLFDIRP